MTWQSCTWPGVDLSDLTRYQKRVLKRSSEVIARRSSQPSGPCFFYTHIVSAGLILPSATLHFVGWVEPISGSVGFRFTQPNLHLVSSIAQCETQQWPILEPSPLRRSRQHFSTKVERFRVQRSGLTNSQPAPIKGNQLLCVNTAFSPNG